MWEIFIFVSHPIPVIYSTSIRQEMGVIQMSKRKILKTVLAAVSVILSAAKSIEKMGRLPESDGKTKRKG